MYRSTLRLICLVLVLGVFTNITNAVVVSHYEFEGNANDSAGNNHGSIVGEVDFGTGPVYGGIDFGQALSLNADGSYIEITDDGSLTPSDELTIAFWVYNKGGSDAGIYKYAHCPHEPYSPGASRAYFAQIAGSGINMHRVKFRIFSAVLTYDDILSNNTIPLNEWHHIATTFNQGQAAIYIDGQLDNTFEMSVSSIMNDVQPLTIGGRWSYCDADHWVNGLNGLMDDLRIYNHALSETEILAIIPEPTTCILLGLGALGLIRRRLPK